MDSDQVATHRDVPVEQLINDYIQPLVDYRNQTLRPNTYDRTALYGPDIVVAIAQPDNKIQSRTRKQVWEAALGEYHKRHPSQVAFRLSKPLSTSHSPGPYAPAEGHVLSWKRLDNLLNTQTKDKTLVSFLDENFPHCVLILDGTGDDVKNRALFLTQVIQTLYPSHLPSKCSSNLYACVLQTTTRSEVFEPSKNIEPFYRRETVGRLRLAVVKRGLMPEPMYPHWPDYHSPRQKQQLHFLFQHRDHWTQYQALIAREFKVHYDSRDSKWDPKERSRWHAPYSRSEIHEWIRRVPDDEQDDTTWLESFQPCERSSPLYQWLRRVADSRSHPSKTLESEWDRVIQDHERYIAKRFIQATEESRALVHDLFHSDQALKPIQPNLQIMHVVQDASNGSSIPLSDDKVLERTGAFIRSKLYARPSSDEESNNNNNDIRTDEQPPLLSHLNWYLKINSLREGRSASRVQDMVTYLNAMNIYPPRPKTLENQTLVLLDLACGEGSISQAMHDHFVQQGFNVRLVAVDSRSLSRPLNECDFILNTHYRDLAPRGLDRFKDRVTSMPAPGSVWMCNVSMAFHHVPSIVEWLKQIAELLAPGGLLSVREHHICRATGLNGGYVLTREHVDQLHAFKAQCKYEYQEDDHFCDSYFAHYTSREELVEMAREAGLVALGDGLRQPYLTQEPRRDGTYSTRVKAMQDYTQLFWKPIVSLPKPIQSAVNAIKIRWPTLANYREDVAIPIGAESAPLSTPLDSLRHKTDKNNNSKNTPSNQTSTVSTSATRVTKQSSSKVASSTSKRAKIETETETESKKQDQEDVEEEVVQGDENDQVEEVEEGEEGDENDQAEELEEGEEGDENVNAMDSAEQEDSDNDDPDIVPEPHDEDPSDNESLTST